MLQVLPEGPGTLVALRVPDPAALKSSQGVHAPLLKALSANAETRPEVAASLCNALKARSPLHNLRCTLHSLYSFFVSLLTIFSLTPKPWPFPRSQAVAANEEACKMVAEAGGVKAALDIMRSACVKGGNDQSGTPNSPPRATIPTRSLLCSSVTAYRPIISSLVFFLNPSLSLTSAGRAAVGLLRQLAGSDVIKARFCEEGGFALTASYLVRAASLPSSP